MTNIENFLEENKEYLNRLDKFSQLEIPNFKLPNLPWTSPHMENEVKIIEFYNDFIFNLLIFKKNMTGKVDGLILRKNFDDSLTLKIFLKKQTITSRGYAEIIKQTDKYVILKLTQEGKNYFNLIGTKYKINEPKFLYRITLYVCNFIIKFLSFFFKSSTDYKIKKFIESGIIKFISLIIVVLTFASMIYLNWDKLKYVFD